MSNPNTTPVTVTRYYVQRWNGTRWITMLRCQDAWRAAVAADRIQQFRSEEIRVEPVQVRR